MGIYPGRIFQLAAAIILLTEHRPYTDVGRAGPPEGYGLCTFLSLGPTLARNGAEKEIRAGPSALSHFRAADESPRYMLRSAFWRVFPMLRAILAQAKPRGPDDILLSCEDSSDGFPLCWHPATLQDRSTIRLHWIAWQSVGPAAATPRRDGPVCVVVDAGAVVLSRIRADRTAGA